MGGLNGQLKEFAALIYPDSKTDLYSMFIQKSLFLVKKTGFVSFVTMQSWMFLSSYEALRRNILSNNTIMTLAHLGPHAFEDILGERVQVCCFAVSGDKINGFLGVFHRLISGNATDKNKGLLNRNNEYPRVDQEIFLRLNDASIAYKISSTPLLIEKMTRGKLIKPNSKIGSQPGSELIYYWWEVPLYDIGKQWRMYNKGGTFRKWSGNQLWILHYGNNGEIVLANGGQLSNQSYYFKPHISWTRVSSRLNLRYYPEGFGFDNTSPAIFDDIYYLIAFFNSCVGEYSRTIKFSGLKLKAVTSRA